MKRQTDPDVLLLQAAADPTRLAILRQLSDVAEVCACDFTACCDVSQPTVSHHLKVLRDAGWIEGERRGTWIWYSLRPQAVARFRELAGGFGPSLRWPRRHRVVCRWSRPAPERRAARSAALVRAEFRIVGPCTRSCCQLRGHLRRRARRQEPAHGPGLRDPLPSGAVLIGDHPRDRCRPRRARCWSAGGRRGAAHARHPRRGRHRLLRLRRLDASRRHARRRRGGGPTRSPLGPGHHRHRVLPGRAGRQDDARHDHPRDDRGTVGTWLGSTAGMVAADGLAIAVGRPSGRGCPSEPSSCSPRPRSSCSGRS